jgi:hypothetical protein
MYFLPNLAGAIIDYGGLLSKGGAVAHLNVWWLKAKDRWELGNF